MTNTELWLSIDRFAADNGLTCAGLAKHCGLHASVFNPSKRTTKYKQPRWLSTETIAKVLNTYNIDVHDYVDKYIPRHNGAKHRNI